MAYQGKNHYTVARFDGDAATLEDDHGRHFTVPREWLPSDANDGDVLASDTLRSLGESNPDFNGIVFELDPGETKKRRQAAGTPRKAAKGAEGAEG